MKPLAFSPAAEADIDGMWDYSAKTWGPDQADRYTDEIRDACLALAHDRKQGRPVDVRPGYLRLSTGSHVIYYRDRGDRLDVIRFCTIAWMPTAISDRTCRVMPSFPWDQDAEWSCRKQRQGQRG